MKKIIITSFFTATVLSLFIGSNLSFLQNDSSEKNLSSAKIFQTSNPSTDRFWDNTINKSTYKNNFSTNFIQNNKYDFAYNKATNGTTHQELPGYRGQSLYNNGSDNPVRSKLDLFSYANELTDTNRLNVPSQNSEYNGYFFGGRTDLFGMSFGLTGNLNYYLQTEDTNSTNSLKWDYQFNLNGPSRSVPRISDSNNKSRTPKYVHGVTTDEDYGSAYTYDFAYYSLWYLGLNKPLEGTNTRPVDNNYPTALTDGNLKLSNHVWSENMGTPTNTSFLEDPWQITYTNNENVTTTYTIYSMIIPNEKTDSIVTEYYDDNDPTNIHLIEDTIANRTIKFKNNTIYQNNGYLFANQMMPYWTTVPNTGANSQFDKLWYNYINYGLFPSSTNVAEDNSFDNYNAFENPILRTTLTTKDISDGVDSFLGYNSSNYDKWRTPTLSNYVTVNNYQAKNSAIHFASNIVADPLTTGSPGEENIFNKISNSNYHFLTYRGPSKYSGENKDNPGLIDSYDSFGSYEFYTAAVGNNPTYANDDNRYYLDINNSSATSSSQGLGSDGTTYSYNSNIIRQLNNKNNQVFNNIDFFPNNNTSSPFPSWATTIIVLFIVLIMIVFGYLFWRNRKIQTWKSSQTSVKKFNESHFIAKDLKKDSRDK